LSGNYSRKLSVKVIIKSTIGREPAEVWCCRTERRAASFSLDFGRVFETRTPVGQVSAGNLELRSRSGISGSQIKPRATSEGRKEVGMNRIDQADNVNNMTCVNSPSSATGVTRDGKGTSRILPTEGGRFRATSPKPRSESAGGADKSPEGNPPRHRRQARESGDAGGRATPGRQPVVVAAESGKHLPHPDEGRPEFTYVCTCHS